MVLITNGIDTFEVSKGAFKSIFKNQGFMLVEGQHKESHSEDMRSEEEMYIAELMEKPLSGWSKDEVKKFAAIKGVDLSGTKSVAEAKEKIKMEFFD